MKKRIFALLLILVLAISALPVVSYAAESDSLLAAKDTNVTRSQFLNSLYKAIKEKGQGFEGACLFKLKYIDVEKIEQGDYEAVAWFTMNGIVNGYASGKFGPDDYLTREQMVTILYRYIQYCGEGFTGTWMFPLPFEDSAEISGWASEAVHWCYMKKIVCGRTSNVFAPKDIATKTEANTLIERFCGGAPQVQGVFLGGWNINTEFTDVKIPDDAKAAFDKAMDGFLGVGYTPVAYLGSQTVSGTNYAFLCKAVTITAMPLTKLVVVIINKDTQGNVQIKETTDLNIADYTDKEKDVEFKSSNMSGGWTVSKACGGTLPEAAQTAFDKANSELSDVRFSPLALLGNQVVAGTKYAVLCLASSVSHKGSNAIVVVSVYADLSGGASISSVNNLSIK